MSNLDCILKSRDITLPRNVLIIKSMAFPVVMYRCEIRAINKAESWRIDTFELWCWRRLLGVPWTARSNLKEINPKYSLERQGNLTCCNSRGRKESDTTERLYKNTWECLFASQSHLSHLPRKLHLHFPNSDGQPTRNLVQKNQTGPLSESLC